MNARGVCVVLVLALFVFGQPTLQAADGWFGNSVTSAGGSSSKAKKSEKSSWFSWPSSKPKAKSSGRSKPSMVQNMARSTKDAWNKTVGFLNPFDNPPAPQATPKSQPNTGSWFPSREPEKKPTSVPDWLSGEMPAY
jgi:hypothetical protein